MTDTLFRHDPCQESQSKLSRLNPTTLSCTLLFFAKENKCPIKIQSITRGAALYHHLGVKLQGERGGSSQQGLYDVFECVALLQPQGQRKLPSVTACGLYLHLAEDITCTFMKLEQLIPDCSDKALFHPTARFLNHKIPFGEFVR